MLVVACAAFLPAHHDARDETISLYNDSGKPVAYIDLEDERTIYMWNGTPSAYLESDPAGGFHVYGFNGKHLGWFVRGAVWDHDGDAACATKDLIQSPEIEGFKSFKKFKPFKSFKEFAPFRPTTSGTFGSTTCALLIAEGQK